MINTQDQDQLFSLVANYLKSNLTCIAIGGTAMMFLGYKNTTKDIDLIFNDPRKFGSVHLTRDPDSFRFFSKLSPEPWDESVSGSYCHKVAAGKSVNLKSFVLSGRPITGIGNIYACEILFQARLNPFMPVSQVSVKEWEAFIRQSRITLQKAIDSGGTTLRDFSGVDGKPGYFYRKLYVYGQKDEPCTSCGNNIEILKDVNVEVSVELGRITMPLGDVLNLSKGSVVELENLAGEQINVLVNGQKIAMAEVVVIGEHFGVRISKLISTKLKTN